MGHPGLSGIPASDHATPQKIESRCHILQGSSLGSRKRVMLRTGSFITVRLFFYGQGLNFDSSEMIYIDE